MVHERKASPLTRKKLLAALEPFLDVPIKALSRVYYVYKGTIDRTAGELQLDFTDGRTVVFGCGSDGESLTVQREAWIDPFALPDPWFEENRAYLEKHGRAILFDVSQDEEPGPFVGQPVVQVAPQFHVLGGKKITGVFLRTPIGCIDAHTGVDDFRVDFIPDE